MKLIKLTQQIYGEDKKEIIPIYINVDQISVIKQYPIPKLGENISTVIILNNKHEQFVCEDIEQVIQRIHLQTIKWKEGQFFINGEPQELTFTYETGLKITNKEKNNENNNN